MLKYVSKFAMDILPSVVATIIGAYIVNHYIVAKPAADAPAAAAVSSADPEEGRPRRPMPSRPRPPPTSPTSPRPGVRAKGISEKAIFEKTAAEKAAAEKAAGEIRAEKSEPTKPAETASIPAETRRHPPGAARKDGRQDRSGAGSSCLRSPRRSSPRRIPRRRSRPPSPPRITRRQRSGPRGDRTPARHERRLAACAGSRSRTPDPPRAGRRRAAPSAAPSVRPLPPPIMVSTPGNDRFDSAPGSSRQAALCGCRAERRSAPPDAAGRYSRPRRRSICVPRRRNRRRARAHECCRRHAVGGEIDVSRGLAEIARRIAQPSWLENVIVALAGLAADARKAASGGFILGAKVDGAAI